MTQDNLFEGGDKTPIIDQNTDYVQELTGPGKKFDRSKYQSTDDLLDAVLKGKYEADKFADILKSEQAELRDEFLKVRGQKTVEDKYEQLIDLIKGQQGNNRDITQNDDNVNAERKEVNLDDIETRVLQKLEQRTVAQKEQDNIKIVQDKLKEELGDNFQAIINKQRESLGLSMEDANALARRSPKAFFKAMGLEDAKQEGFQAPPRSVQRSDSFAPSTQKRTWSFYQKLKAEKPELYWNPKTRSQMYKDHDQLGAAFEDGDYSLAR